MAIKVLQLICPTGYYGAERWVNALLSAQHQANIEQHLAITEEPDTSDEVLQKCGLPAHRQHRLAMASKFDIRVVNRLVQLIKNQRIDIIHTHGYKSDIIGAIAAKLAKIKSVCTPHGFENASDIKLKAYMWLGGKSFHSFDFVCPLSPQIESDVITHYKVNANKVRLINNGVDLSEVEQALASTEIPANEPFTIGYIGQLITRKNLPDLLQAFAQFQTLHAASQLLIIGDGPERNNLETLAANLGIAQQTQFLGFRDDRLQLLPSFDSFALTSSLEGIPRCLMEAMAANVCVTAFNIPGVDVLIEPYKTGLTVPFGDTNALAQAWLSLASNPTLKQQLAAAGKAFVYDRYSATAMATAYASLYEELITENTDQHA